jgi:hypothetical protein
MTDTVAESIGAQAFSPGRTLRVGLAVLGRNLGPFLVITVLISLPYIALQTLLDFAAAANAAEGNGPTTGGNVAIFFVQTVTFALVQAALTYGTVQDLRGERASLGDCFRHGLARAGHVVMGSVQYGIMIGLGTLLLLIPGILLFLRWWVFMPAMVVEGLKPQEGFKRSTALTGGRRWSILGLTAVVFAVQLGLMMVAYFVIPEVLPPLAADIAVTVIAVLFSTVSSVLAAVGYYHLRVEKEGVIIDDLAKVFD